MTVEKLKESIRFKTFSVSECRGIMTATLAVQADTMFDQDTVAAGGDDAVEFMKERLRRDILRCLYADRRQDLQQALRELFCVSPMDYAGLSEAREKLLSACQFQEP